MPPFDVTDAGGALRRRARARALEHESAAPPERFLLRHFTPGHAATVASWVTDDRDLFWLAPSTPPPLTAGKVLAWTQRRGCPLLMHTGGEDTPIGYAELNPMRTDARHLWLGHVLLAPGRRGRGLGVTLVRLLLDHASMESHATRVSLVVFPRNRAAIQCYLRAGFEFRGEQYHRFGRAGRSYRMLHLVASARAAAQ